MGATNTAPSQKSGFFLCKSKATAPPMDSPNKYLIFSLFSCFSKIKQKEEEEMTSRQLIYTIIKNTLQEEK
jgi:hypothetical protein